MENRPLMHPEMAAVLEQGAVVLTANRRLARSLRSEYDRARRNEGRTAWPAPDILPLAAWLRRLWEQTLYSGAGGVRLPLSGWQERLLWTRAIQESEAGASLLQLDATGDSARQAWTLLHAWRLPFSKAHFDSGEDPAAFFGWALHYQDACERLAAIDEARLPEYVTGRLDSPRQVWLAGFDEFTPQQEALLAALEKQGRDVVNSQVFELPAPSAGLAGFADRETELDAAARWARRKLEQTASARIGIIIPDLEAARPAVERIFTEVLQPGGAGRLAFHISLGPPLATRPLVHAALRILETLRPRVPLSTATSLLLSPYTAGAREERTARALLDARLRRDGALEHPLNAFSDPSCPRLSRVVAACEAVSGPLAASEWSAQFAARLRVFGWPGDERLSSEEFQTVEAWRRALGQMAALDLVLPPLDTGAAISLIRRIVWETPFETEDLGQPVQVMGMLEASGSEFDHLWIAGLDEDAWPRPPAANPFLPLALQRARRMPHSSPERELDYAGTVTRRLLCCADEIVVSYARSHGEKTLGPSPLVAHLPRISPPELPKPWYLRPGPVEVFQDDAGPALEHGAVAPGGARTLQLQADCPFRAFAEVRLGARRLEDPDAGLDPRRRGLILHKALELAWRELESQEKLLEASAEQIGAVLRRAISAALREVRTPPGEFTARLRAIEEARLLALLAAWLDLEKSRAGKFTVLPPEQERQVSIGGLLFNTRMDRVDRLSDGRHVLIDYKMNAPANNAWEGERPTEPQLPLYAATLPGPVAAVAFAHVHTGEASFRGCAASRDLLPGARAEDVPGLIEQWRAVVDRLAAQFREGYAAVDPKQGDTCGRCHLHSLCRVDEERI